MSRRPMICEICQHVLDARADEDGVTFTHAPRDRADHEPVPVQAPEGWTGGRCDFCIVEQPKFELPVRSFTVPGTTNRLSGEDWAACELCARLIQTDQWEALLARAVTGFTTSTGQPPELGGVLGWAVLYSLVRDNITGPLRPITPGE